MEAEVLPYATPITALRLGMATSADILTVKFSARRHA